MGPHTLEALRAELTDLMGQVEGHSQLTTVDFWLTGTQQAAIRVRIQKLRAMLDEVETGSSQTSQH